VDVDVARRRRRANSRVFRASREIYKSEHTESIISDWTSSHVSRPIVQSIESVSKSNEVVRSRLAQAHKGLDVEEKLTLECEYFTLKPLDTKGASSVHLSKEAAWTNSPISQSLGKGDFRKSLSIAQTRSKSFQTRSDWSDDIELTKEDDTLPPYHKIVKKMFYRFCGISHGSNSRQLQSRGDFKQLLKCLGMKEFIEDFLIWFPEPKSMKSDCGYISLKMFSDFFSGRFAQSVLEKRWEYETLCSAIMTMNYLDKKKLNRIEFPQFLRLYRGLYDSEISVGNVSSVFNKYDIYRSGMLTIVDIFNFCCDEDLGLE